MKYVAKELNFTVPTFPPGDGSLVATRCIKSGACSNVSGGVCEYVISVDWDARLAVVTEANSKEIAIYPFDGISRIRVVE